MSFIKQYYLTYKPFGMVCQFSGEPGDVTLKSLNADLSKDVYSVGRLDKDSEGLLLLTNDNLYKTKLLNPKSNKVKTYLVQVEGSVSEGQLTSLSNGSIQIKHNKKTHRCKPCKVKKVVAPDWLPKRNPPIRERKSIPTTWIEVSISEGKNRQVRKMTAKVGLPTLRLIRIQVDDVILPRDIQPGDVLSFKI